MEELDIQRLLAEKWSTLRHIEAERHWFLAFYAVISAGVLAFLGQRNLASLSSVGVYLVPVGLGIVGLLHAFRAAWMLGQLHHDLNQITANWEQGEEPHKLKPYWGFSKVDDPFTKGFLGFWNWVLSLYLFIKFVKDSSPAGAAPEARRLPIKFVPPTFAALYIWAYTIAVVFFFCIAFQAYM